MDQVLIQLVMDAQGELSLEYLADMGRLLPPEKIVKLLAHKFTPRRKRMAEERCKVLTRSEGEEERCIVIKPDGHFAKALQLIRDEDSSRGQYEVNGKRWRPANSAVPWERDSSSFEEVVELYRREDTWAPTAGGPILESD